jgi:hypothetical protein
LRSYTQIVCIWALTRNASFFAYNPTIVFIFIERANIAINISKIALDRQLAR